MSRVGIVYRDLIIGAFRFGNAAGPMFGRFNETMRTALFIELSEYFECTLIEKKFDISDYKNPTEL